MRQARGQIPFLPGITLRILLRSDGSYAGFDRSAPTSSDGGKARVVAQLQARLGPAVRPLVMIGDGVTDMQVRWGSK